MRVERYTFLVRQYYKCFAFGHVANRDRKCRDCEDSYHSEECSKERWCVNTEMFNIPAITKTDILERMSIYSKSVYEASQFFPTNKSWIQ